MEHSLVIVTRHSWCSDGSGHIMIAYLVYKFGHVSVFEPHQFWSLKLQLHTRRCTVQLHRCVTNNRVECMGLHSPAIGRLMTFCKSQYLQSGKRNLLVLPPYKVWKLSRTVRLWQFTDQVPAILHKAERAQRDSDNMVQPLQNGLASHVVYIVNHVNEMCNGVLLILTAMSESSIPLIYT